MKRLLLLILLLSATSCVTSPNSKGEPELLNFLEDGKTTKQETLLKLGQPSGNFESETALTYRLGFNPNNQGYYIMDRKVNPSGWPVWYGVKFSLVLVFDETGVLRKHALVEVN
jgi:hypothetical protein